MKIMVKVSCVFIKMKSGLSVSKRTGSRTMTVDGCLPGNPSFWMNSLFWQAGEGDSDYRSEGG